MKISPAPFTNAQMKSLNIQRLETEYSRLGPRLERTSYGMDMWGHIVMKSRARGPDPELSVGMVPERIVKMYPNGDKILYEFKKLNAYNKEQTTVSQIRKLINGTSARKTHTNDR